MGWRAELRAREAAHRRQQREAQRHFRELSRRAEEEARLSEQERARLEVETYENQLEVLLSVHKEQGNTWDWAALAVALPPPFPERNSCHENRAKRSVALPPFQEPEVAQAKIEEARLQDEQAFEQAKQRYGDDTAEWEALRSLAPRILAGDSKAYTQALVEFSPLAEISDLGSSIHFTVHTEKLIECVLKVNGRQAIPSEVKTLTTSGRVSMRPMPKKRFHEIYQDYLCGCVLRVAREVLALLPVETVLITATADTVDTGTGQVVEKPVLSVAMPRLTMARLDFDRIDPSDSMEDFLHRGDFKATRKSEAFQPITPLAPADIATSVPASPTVQALIENVRRLREELKTEIQKLSNTPDAFIREQNPSI